MILKKSTLFAVALLLFPIAGLLNFSIYDELFTLFCILYIILNRKKLLSEKEKSILYLLGVSYLLGFISNYNSDLISLYIPIFVDAFTIYKQLLVFILLRNIISEKDSKQIIKLLTPAAIFFIVTAFIFGILSQIINLNMTEGERYGIQAYHFILPGSMFAITNIGCILILASSSMKKKQYLFYMVLALTSLVLTTKGVFYSFVIFGIAIYMFNSKTKLKVRNLVMLSVILILASGYQIDTYLKDLNSPRMLFIKYGIDTANDYFPLGSGFATYGSEEARQNYSPLYYKYGFNSLWGMSEEDSKYLNDNYLAMVVGQLGYLGLILYFIIIFRLFQLVNNYENRNLRSSILITSALLMLYVTSIATGIFKSASGVFLFAILAMLLPTNKGINNERKTKDK